MCITNAPNKSFIYIPLVNIYLVPESEHDNCLSKKPHQCSLTIFKIIALKIN